LCVSFLSRKLAKFKWVCLFFYVFLVSWSLVCAKKEEDTFFNWIYIHISLVVSCSWGSKSDHVSHIENIDIWSRALLHHSHFSVFFFLPKGMVSSNQDFRPRCEILKSFAAFLCCSLVFVQENLNLGRELMVGFQS
jgi:hypothetical protein